MDGGAQAHRADDSGPHLHQRDEDHSRLAFAVKTPKKSTAIIPLSLPSIRAAPAAPPWSSWRASRCHPFRTSPAQIEHASAPPPPPQLPAPFLEGSRCPLHPFPRCTSPPATPRHGAPRPRHSHASKTTPTDSPSPEPPHRPALVHPLRRARRAHITAAAVVTRRPPPGSPLHCGWRERERDELEDGAGPPGAEQEATRRTGGGDRDGSGRQRERRATAIGAGGREQRRRAAGDGRKKKRCGATCQC